jgi:hypothetical protein
VVVAYKSGSELFVTLTVSVPNISIAGLSNFVYTDLTIYVTVEPTTGHTLGKEASNIPLPKLVVVPVTSTVPPF